ncbi:hypothetical protein L2E82_51667 [Cichorium intybus]|nr:hypothetical protein L2E82_51667 [Cichorium intybus]
MPESRVNSELTVCAAIEFRLMESELPEDDIVPSKFNKKFEIRNTTLQYTVDFLIFEELEEKERNSEYLLDQLIKRMMKMRLRVAEHRFTIRN